MSGEYDDSALRSLVDGLADGEGRISVGDFSQLICEQMGVSEEQAGEVTQQLDPNGEGYIDVDLIYQAFQALIPQGGSNQASLTGSNSGDDVDYGGGEAAAAEGSGGSGGGEEDDDDAPPPELPTSPEPTVESLRESILLEPKPPTTEGLSTPRQIHSEAEEEFIGEGEEEDIPSGAMSPMRVLSPKRSMSMQRHTSTFSLSSPQTHLMNRGVSMNSLNSSVSAELQDHLHDEQIKQMSDKVQELNEQLASVLEERDSSENLQKKLKQEYVGMQTRLHHLEEQMRERDESSQQALRNAQEKQKLKIAHLENKYNSQQGSMKEQLAANQEEIRQLNGMEATLRDQYKEVKKDATALKEEVESQKRLLAKKDADHQLLVSQQERETAGAVNTIEHLQKQVEEITMRHEQSQKECAELREKNRRTKTMADNTSLETKHLEEEVQRLHKEVARLSSRNTELSQQLVQQGKRLMESPEAAQNVESLEAEMNEQSKDEIMKLLREERNAKGRLKEYVDNLLVVVMEQSPHLLEMRTPKK